MDRNFLHRVWERGQKETEPANAFKTDKQEYKCKRCGKVFEAIAYKSDNQAACPFCPGIGDRIN